MVNSLQSSRKEISMKTMMSSLIVWFSNGAPKKVCLPNKVLRMIFGLLLVNLGLFMCHIYWSGIEQLSVLYAERYVP